MGIVSSIKSLFSKKKENTPVEQLVPPTVTPEPVVADNETLTTQIEEPKAAKKIEVKKAAAKKETAPKAEAPKKETKKTTGKKQTKKEK